MIRRIVKNIKNRSNSHNIDRRPNVIPKYFCIGRNKTGTTSLCKAFEQLGFQIGDQRTAEKLADRYYFKGMWDPILSYCESAQVFQDAPFSWAGTYQKIDKAYPGSKFILTIRDDADQWYQSLTRFHAKRFGKGHLPTADDLRKARYIGRGYIYKAVKLHGTPDDDIYNEAIMVAHYNSYNQTIIRYFEDRQKDFLVINLAKEGAYRAFIDFVGLESNLDKFPWENRTQGG